MSRLLRTQRTSRKPVCYTVPSEDEFTDSSDDQEQSLLPSEGESLNTTKVCIDLTGANNNVQPVDVVRNIQTSQISSRLEQATQSTTASRPKKFGRAPRKPKRTHDEDEDYVPDTGMMQSSCSRGAWNVRKRVDANLTRVRREEKVHQFGATSVRVVPMVVKKVQPSIQTTGTIQTTVGTVVTGTRLNTDTTDEICMSRRDNGEAMVRIDPDAIRADETLPSPTKTKTQGVVRSPTFRENLSSMGGFVSPGLSVPPKGGHLSERNPMTTMKTGMLGFILRMQVKSRTRKTQILK